MTTLQGCMTPYTVKSASCVLSHTDGLTDRVGIVGDLEVRQMLPNFLGHLFRGEAHGGDIVGAQGQLALWSLHELYCGTVAVGNVHHWKTGVRTQIALMVACAESVVEDLNGIVCEEEGPERCSQTD